MNDNTIKLLKECSSGCQMAMDSVKTMREYTKDAKLNDLLEAYGEKHRGLEREIADEEEKLERLHLNAQRREALERESEALLQDRKSVV